VSLLTSIFLTIISLLFFSILIILSISTYVSWKLTHPKREKHNTTPQDFDLSYEDVVFQSRKDKLNLKGWLIRAAASQYTITFSHGYGKDRLHDNIPALALAKDFVQHGYNVLLFDYRNSGESEGNLTSMGQYEIDDLLGALDFIKSQGDIGEHVGVIGFSMGAATALMAAARDEGFEVAIADSSFADLTTYLEENLPVWSRLPAIPFNAIIKRMVPILTGLDSKVVSPIKEIGQVKGWILLIHGARDTKVPVENSQELFRAAKLTREHLIIIPDANHIQGYKVNSELYKAKLFTFLDKWKVG
jgi:uncharacterized protein